MENGSKAQHSPLSYFPQLDGLRAIAILSVLVDHFGLHALLGFNLSKPGVRLFFVLSGFLITSILIRSRNAVDAKAETPGVALRRFWARRALRIFPIYYLALLVLVIIGFDSMHWHFLYLSNVYFSINGPIPVVGHFWSLAVEEQFYLVWPFVILFVPRRHILTVCVAAICAAPTFRLVGMFFGMNEIAAQMLPFANLDTLAAGAVLACLVEKSNPGQVRRLRVGGLICGLSLLAVLTLARGIADVRIVGLKDTALALLFFWAVSGAVDGYKGIVGRVLTCGVLRYIGKISYGLYIYHNFMLQLVPKLCRSLSLPYPDHGIGRALLLFAATFLLAALSWWLVERPILSLKRHFSAPTPRRAARWVTGKPVALRQP